MATPYSEILTDLQERTLRTDEMYDPYHSKHECYGVIAEEFHELMLALHQSHESNFEAELMDIAVVCLRWLGRSK